MLEKMLLPVTDQYKVRRSDFPSSMLVPGQLLPAKYYSRKDLQSQHWWPWHFDHAIYASENEWPIRTLILPPSAEIT